jgi:hypothetical protein
LLKVFIVKGPLALAAKGAAKHAASAPQRQAQIFVEGFFASWGIFYAMQPRA